MKRLFVIATGSAGKIRDFAHILGTDHYEFKTLKDIGFDEDIIEDGNTFAENAIIKSNTTAQWLAKKNIEATVLADDSGLEVFALNSEPGIYSVDAKARRHRRPQSTLLLCTLVPDSDQERTR